MKQLLFRIYEQAVKLNKRNILDMLDHDAAASLLDLGCDDGEWTTVIGGKIGTHDLNGVEIVDERIAKAEAKGIRVIKSDLNHPLPFASNQFDVVHANQVIEHVADANLFASEIHRVLKPNGYAIVSTENGSSWHNIFASIMGWQIFSLTNVSSQCMGIGNPWAMHRGESTPPSWTHKTIFNHRGLIEFFQVHRFAGIKVVGAGYHPLPPQFGRWEARHSHFLTLKAFKQDLNSNE